MTNLGGRCCYEIFAKKDAEHIQGSGYGSIPTVVEEGPEEGRDA